MLLNLPGMLKLTKLESIFITAALMDHFMNLKSNGSLFSFTAHVRQLLLHLNFYYFFIILFFPPRHRNILGIIKSSFSRDVPSNIYITSEALATRDAAGARKLATRYLKIMCVSFSVQVFSTILFSLRISDLKPLFGKLLGLTANNVCFQIKLLKIGVFNEAICNP